MGLFGARRSHRADAVITGAGSGIGAAFATELARRGGRVLCSDIDPDAAQATADALRADGGTALATPCDVTDVTDVHRLADTAQSFFGGAPTLVINNAGVGAGGAPIGETDLADWNWVLGINLWGPIHGCHVFAPILREAGRPAGIINVASAAAFGAAPGMPPTTSARPARCPCRRRCPPNSPARASPSPCCARRSSRPTSSEQDGSPTGPPNSPTT